jgi:hypothetical protein
MATGELVVEEVAENLEEAAQAVRRLDTKSVSFLLVGLGVGAAVGFWFGYRYNKEKIKAEAFEESQEQILQIRDYYERTQKPELQEIIEERGYVEPADVVPSRPLPAPVPVREPQLSVVEEPEPVAEVVGKTPENAKDKDEGWNYPFELQRRSATHPYIIHQDEFIENETEFGQVTLTYYEDDAVLADTDDSPIHNQVSLLGDGTLSRFGHGTDDHNTLYVRNPVLEMEYEICRVQKSFEEEVEGLTDAPDVTDPRD